MCVPVFLSVHADRSDLHRDEHIRLVMMCLIGNTHHAEIAKIQEIPGMHTTADLPKYQEYKPRRNFQNTRNTHHE